MKARWILTVLLVVALVAGVAVGQTAEPSHRVTDATGQTLDVVLPVTFDTIPADTTTTSTVPPTTTIEPPVTTTSSTSTTVPAADPFAPATPPSGAITISNVAALATVPQGADVVLTPGIHKPNRVTIPEGVTVYGQGLATLDGEYTRDVAFVLSDDVTLDGIDATRYNGNGWTGGGTGDRRAQGQAPFKGPADRVTIRAYNGYLNRHSAVRVEGNEWTVSGWRAWDNGQHGLTGGGNDALIEHFEWFRNGNESPIRFFATDRGGSKITYSNRMTLRHGLSYDHEDMGVWADGNNRDLVLIDVESRHNRKNGFNWEVNPGPITMIDCRGFDNGYDEPGNAAPSHVRWSQVFISSSGDVTVQGGEFRGRKGVGVWNDWGHSAYDHPDWGDDIGSQNIKVTGAVIEGSVIVAGVNVLGSPSRWDVDALAVAERWFEGNTLIGDVFSFGGEVVTPAEWSALGFS